MITFITQKFSKTKYIALFTLIIAMFFTAGAYTGYSYKIESNQIALANKDTPTDIPADFAPFWKVWNTINEKSPEGKKITDQEKVYGAISGLIGSLDDPYSVFFKPEEAKAFQEEIAGNFSGIGMEVGIKDKILTVIAPLKDTPAYKANIKPGDRILKIDNKITADITVEEAVKLIRGDKGTAVKLTILHDGDRVPIEIKIIRDTINIPTLDTELRKDGIFVIKLYSFSATSVNLFRNAIKEFSTSKSDKLLLDLRGNPGGFLDAANDMASWFLPEGKTIVTEDYGENKKPIIFRSKGYNLFSDKLKFVILINGGSASASEILAGAMQDYKLAKLVGSQSFGKGSVQELLDVTHDTVMKITVAKWLTPNGNTIMKKGLTPDYVVEVTKNDLEKKKDPQMEKAVKILLNWK